MTQGLHFRLRHVVTHDARSVNCASVPLGARGENGFSVNGSGDTWADRPDASRVRAVRSGMSVRACACVVCVCACVCVSCVCTFLCGLCVCACACVCVRGVSAYVCVFPVCVRAFACVFLACVFFAHVCVSCVRVRACVLFPAPIYADTQCGTQKNTFSPNTVRQNCSHTLRSMQPLQHRDTQTTWPRSAVSPTEMGRFSPYDVSTAVRAPSSQGNGKLQAKLKPRN